MMVRVAVCNRRFVMRWLMAGVFPVLLLFAVSPALADSPIVRVEEDWEMVLLTPDPNSVGPQVVCAISPVGDLNSVYATFEINHGSYPKFSGGGLNLQVWNGDSHVSTQTFPNASVLTKSGETVSWTQSMEVQNGQVVFEIVNGHSATWGDFGGQGNLKATVICSVSDLNGYSPDVSMASSGVTFASNRVASLTLKSIRAVRADGTTVSITVNQVVHQYTEN